MAIPALLHSEILNYVTNIWTNLRLFCMFQATQGGTHSNNLTNQSFILKLHKISITHIVNEKSKYHEHMMTKAGVPGRYPGHEKCMNAYSKNYGCEDCIWLKWYGELHGYPDIHPANFKKHLEPTEWEVVRSKIQ